MKYELLIQDEGGMSYTGEAGADTLEGIVAMREDSPRRTIIVEHLDPIAVYAQVQRMKEYGRLVEEPIRERSYRRDPNASDERAPEPGPRTGDLELTPEEEALLLTPPVVAPGVAERPLVYEAEEVRR